MKLGGASTLAQWVVPDRDGLAQVDLVLTAEMDGLPGMVELTVEEVADGAFPGVVWPPILPAPDRRRVVRKSSVAASALPIGPAWRVGPGTPEEAWVPVMQTFLGIDLASWWFLIVGAVFTVANTAVLVDTQPVVVFLASA
jgi:hypothetical protein